MSQTPGVELQLPIRPTGSLTQALLLLTFSELSFHILESTPGKLSTPESLTQFVFKEPKPTPCGWMLLLQVFPHAASSIPNTSIHSHLFKNLPQDQFLWKSSLTLISSNAVGSRCTVSPRAQLSHTCKLLWSCNMKNLILSKVLTTCSLDPIDSIPILLL